MFMQEKSETAQLTIDDILGMIWISNFSYLVLDYTRVLGKARFAGDMLAGWVHVTFVHD